MKRLLFVLAFIACVCEVNAQLGIKKVSCGARLGMNVSRLDNYKSKVGFHLGVVADYELKESFFLESGLLITTKGAKKDSKNEDGEREKEKYNLTYLQLPILATYKNDLGNDLKLYGKVGPYLAVGLSAKKMRDFTNPNHPADNDSEIIKGFGKTPDNADKDSDLRTGLKAFDAGLLFGAGVSKGPYYLGLNYEVGLANIWAYDDGEVIKTGSLNISLGYNF